MSDGFVTTSGCLQMLAQSASVPIPDYTSTSLPGPAWLIEALLLITFWVHMLFVMASLGAVLVVFARSWSFLVNRFVLSTIDRKMIRAIPPILSLTITTGIAPLLFVQTLFGHYSYSSNIFLGYFWLGSLVLLLAGFICLYLTGWLWQWKISLPALVVLPVCFVGIAYINTNNAILTIQPEHWIEFHRNISYLHVKDPITVPRFVNNISYSIIIGGLFLVWTARSCRDSVTAENTVSETHSTGKVNISSSMRTGYLIHLTGLVLMIASSVWYYQSWPQELKVWIFNNQSGNIFLTNLKCIWLGFAGLIFLNSLISLARPEKLLGLVSSTALSAVLVAAMVVVREYIRHWYLAREVAGSFSIANWQVATQNSAIAVFIASFVLALIIVFIMLVMITRKPAKTVS